MIMRCVIPFERLRKVFNGMEMSVKPVVRRHIITLAELIEDDESMLSENMKRLKKRAMLYKKMMNDKEYKNVVAIERGDEINVYKLVYKECKNNDI